MTFSFAASASNLRFKRNNGWFMVVWCFEKAFGQVSENAINEMQEFKLLRGRNPRSAQRHRDPNGAIPSLFLNQKIIYEMNEAGARISIFLG